MKLSHKNHPSVLDGKNIWMTTATHNSRGTRERANWQLSRLHHLGWWRGVSCVWFSIWQIRWSIHSKAVWQRSKWVIFYYSQAQQISYCTASDWFILCGNESMGSIWKEREGSLASVRFLRFCATSLSRSQHFKAPLLLVPGGKHQK